MLRNRPAAFLCLVFSAGIAAGLFFEYHAFLVALSIVIAVCVAKKLLGKKFVISLFAGILLLLGTLYTFVYTMIDKPPKTEYSTVYTFYAAVKSVSVYSDNSTLELDIQDSSSPFNNRTAYMYLKGNSPKQSSVIKVSATLVNSTLRAKSNGIDYIAYGTFETSDIEAKGIYYKIDSMRQAVLKYIDKCYDKESASFYKALLIGDRSGISAKENASFLRSGILHILAISGQHFSLIILGIYQLLIGIIKSKRLCSSICIIAAILYAGFTDFSPSVIRAAFMCCAVFVAYIFKERSDSLITMSIALVVMLLIRPYSIINTGLLLSFAATLGIILTADKLEKFYGDSKVKKAFKWLITPAVFSIAASLFCVPVYMLSFDCVSLISPITNILVNSLVGPAMVCGIVALPLNALGINFVSFIAEALYKIILFISDAAAALQFSCLSLDVPYIWLLVVPAIITMVVLAAFYLKKTLVVLASSALASVLICFCCYGAMISDYKDNSLIYVYDTKDNFYCFYADNKSFILIDGFGSSDASDGVFKNGAAYLDGYVITDCTKSSYNRLCKTIPYLPTKTLFIPETNSEYALQIIEVCKEHDCKVKTYNKYNGLQLSSICIYGGDGYDGSALFIKGEKQGSSVAVFGKGEGINTGAWGKTDTLVITRACTESPCDADFLPMSCNKAILYEKDKSYISDFIINQNIAAEISTFSKCLCFRFGSDGVYEVTINE